MIIPLNKPYWDRKEEKAAIEALRSGSGIGDLSFSQRLSEAISQKISAKCVLPTASGTAALELACAVIFKKGDEVIMPSFTFSSCANAVMLAAARPVFCDIDIKTFNIDPAEIEKKITKKTRAIMVVHYAGFACKMDEIAQIAQRHKLVIIEDAAHALGSKYKNDYLGAIGEIGCFSFHGTKNTASGEGGAFVTNNPKVARIAEIVREKGTNRSSFVRGERKKYSWVAVGRSLVLSDILAAIALVQVDKLEIITNLRRKNAQLMLEKLAGLSSKIFLPQEPRDCLGNWHIFAIRIPRAIRDRTIARLRSYGIEASFHYLPLHTSPMGKKLGNHAGDLPITEEVASTLVRLPIYPQLKKSEIDYIAAVLEKVL